MSTQHGSPHPVAAVEIRVLRKMLNTQGVSVAKYNIDLHPLSQGGTCKIHPPYDCLMG